MRRGTGRTGAALVTTVAATALAVGLATGCGPRADAAGAASTASPSTAAPSATTAPSASPSASSSPSASATGSRPPSATPRRTTAAPRTSAPRIARTVLPEVTVSVATAGGVLRPVRGGAAREFTVTLRNDTARDFPRFATGLTMEPYWVDEAPRDPALVLQRRDPATGAWRDHPLHVATDAGVLYVTTGGTALPRGGVRTERYRLRALATGPAGRTTIGVYGVVTGLPQDASFESRGSGHATLPLSVTRAG